MRVLITAGGPALQAVTFDAVRLTGQRAERNFSSTRSKE
jgi:hypothetical protein